MTLPDLYAIPKRLIADLSDLGTFFRSPRSFQGAVSQEPPLDTLRRTIVYSVVFELSAVVLLLFAVPSAVELSAWQIVLIGIAELVLALPLVTASWIGTRTMTIRPRFRAVLITTVVVKLAALLPIVALYSLYLLTESLVFAYGRGIATWIVAVGISFAVPYLMGRSSRRRLVAGVISFFIIAAMRILLALAVAHSPAGIPDSYLRMLLTYDPIAAELEELKVRELISPPDLEPMLDASIGIVQALSTNPDSFDPTAFSDELSTIVEVRGMLVDHMADARNPVSLLPENLRFQTSRRVVDLVRAQIDAIGQVALAADKVTSAPSTDLRIFLLSLNEMSSSIAEVIAVHGSLQDVYYGSLIPRYNMALAGLSTW